MSLSLLNYIRTLSLADKKSLTQKALKTTEECGELAKKVLPYEGAFATNHRIFSRESVLEEAVDVMLCALSVGYSLEFDTHEIEAMVFKKASKWDELQQREEGVTFPVPFEIHITVNLKNSTIDKFKQVCAQVNVKPIVLDLQNRQGVAVMNDVMTSSKHIGSNTSALKYANDLVKDLTDAGMDVVRTKIETVPWHPAAPQTSDQPMPKNCYFEAHVPVIVHRDMLESVHQFVQDEHLDVHASRNVFKTNPDGTIVVMLTYRTMYGSGNRRDFEESVNEIKTALLTKFTLGSCHLEFALYDTKVSHDDSWLK